MHTGSCLCKKVTFELDGDFDGFFLCHCSRCRKVTGSAHASNLFTKTGRLKWTVGQEQVKTFHLADTRFAKSFCCNCGSALPTDQGKRILVPAGCLDNPVRTKPNAHIFTGSRADWDHDLAQVVEFEELPTTESRSGTIKAQRAFSGAPWEGKVGYCRAIKQGNHIAVSGTAPVGPDGHVYAPGDAYRQARRCLEIVEHALKDLGASISSVTRSRMFVTDISLWADYGRAHQEFFGNNPPATSMVEVKSLIDPQMLIEIEVDAIVQE
jgi:hypothetical protein